MSNALASKLYTVKEYLEFEDRSRQRHEYIDGEIVAMAGASRRHSRIASNIGGELYQQVKGKRCEVHYGDLRLKVRKTHYVYGDVAVFCGEPELEIYKETETLLNPKVIFKVLSKSTEARDRGEKASDYRQIESLTDYFLVAQKKVWVEHYSRQKDGSWKLVENRDLAGVIRLSSINSELKVADIYAGVESPKLRLI